MVERGTCRGLVPEEGWPLEATDACSTCRWKNKFHTACNSFQTSAGFFFPGIPVKEAALWCLHASWSSVPAEERARHRVTRLVSACGQSHVVTEALDGNGQVASSFFQLTRLICLSLLFILLSSVMVDTIQGLHFPLSVSIRGILQ